MDQFWVTNPSQFAPSYYRDIEEITYVGITDVSIEVHTATKIFRITHPDFSDLRCVVLEKSGDGIPE